MTQHIDIAIIDRQWMELALRQAELSAAAGEVPVGAVLVLENKLLAEAHNMPISLNDPTAHAEILALRKAAVTIGNYRLPQASLYVTLEPCPMCAGALLHARIARVVYGASDPKTGALASLYRMGRDGLFNHSLEVSGGVLEEKCSRVLKDFFAARRSR